MSNPESAQEIPKSSKIVQNIDNGNGKEKQQAVKRSFSTPQSPLKIEQQRRNETFGSNVSENLSIFI